MDDYCSGKPRLKGRITVAQAIDFVGRILVEGL